MNNALNKDSSSLNTRFQKAYSKETLLYEHDVRIFAIEKYIKKKEEENTTSNISLDDSEISGMANNLASLNTDFDTLKIENEGYKKGLKETNTTVTTVKASLLIQMNNLSKELEELKKTVKKINEDSLKTEQIKEEN